MPLSTFCIDCENEGCEQCQPNIDDIIDDMIQDLLLIQHHPELTHG